jgi:hypothetical protein
LTGGVVAGGGVPGDGVAAGSGTGAGPALLLRTLTSTTGAASAGASAAVGWNSPFSKAHSAAPCSANTAATMAVQRTQS